MVAVRYKLLSEYEWLKTLNSTEIVKQLLIIIFFGVNTSNAVGK